MARIRSIKPAFFLNEELAALPFEWRLLFVGLWTQADREGRLEDRPQRLKAALFPYDDLEIGVGLGCLANAGLIIRYEGSGQRLISIPTWMKHQQPHIREAVSELPAPCASTVLAPAEPVGLGKGADQEQIREGVRGALLARFERFWDVYPRKTAKDAARKVWLKLAPDDALTQLMIAKVRDHCRTSQWTKDDGEFIPHGRTWLNQKRWEDECDQRSGFERRTVSVAEPYHWKACPHAQKCGSARECNVLKASSGKAVAS